MATSRPQDDFAIQVPFIPEDEPILEKEPENPPICTISKPAKKAFYHSFALVSAFTHAINSFTAGTALMSLIENSDSKSIGEILWEGTAAVSVLNLSISSLLGMCSFSVNYAQVFDYLPKMRHDLLSLHIFDKNITTEKKATAGIALLLSSGAAICSAIFAWDTFNSIPNPWIRYPLSFISSAVQLTMTMATRYVRTKQQMEEIPFFYSKEDTFLLKFMKELENVTYLIKNNHRDVLGETKDQNDIIYVTDQLITLFKARELSIKDRADLEEAVDHLFRYQSEMSKQNPHLKFLKNMAHQSYVVLCTLMTAEVFGEKLAGIFPRFSGKGAITWDIFRLCIGMVFASSHVITYHLMARDIPEILYRSYQISPKKTIFWFVINMGAASNSLNYYLSVADNHPVIPIPKKNSPYGIGCGLIEGAASFNLNYDSSDNRHILPKSTPLVKELRTFRKSITEEKPVHDQATYNHASRNVRFTFFKSEAPSPEGCFARLRRRLHL